MIEKFLINMLSFLLTIYFTCLIVFKTYNYQLTYVVDIFLVLTFITIMLNKKIYFYKINFFILLYISFVILCLASTLWAVDFYQSFFRTIQLSLLLINIMIIYLSFKNFNLENSFLNGILLGVLINFLILIGVLHVSFDPYTLVGGGRALGTTGNANMLAIIMLISIFVSFIYLNKKEKINKLMYYYQYINLFISSYIIFLTMSKKGIIFGFVLLIIILLLSLKDFKKFINIMFFSILLIGVFVNFIDIDVSSYLNHIIGRFSSFGKNVNEVSDPFGSTGERIFLINFGLSTFQNSPIFGHGIANFFLLNERNIYAHNNYIELLVDLGIVGIVLYYSIHVYLLKSFFMLKNNFSMKIFFIIFLFVLVFMDFALVSYGMKLLIYTLLFISIYLDKLKKEENEIVKK